MKSGSFRQKKCAIASRSWVKRVGYALTTAAAIAVSSNAFAACQYEIVNDWGSGFTASITITNSTTAPITGWNVGWQYANTDRMTNGWNANFSGTNPYTAGDFGWNGTLQPNQSVTIGFQGTKSGAAEIPVITGSVCESGDTPVSSAPTSMISSSSVSSAAESSAEVSSEVSSSQTFSSEISSSETSSSETSSSETSSTETSSSETSSSHVSSSVGEVVSSAHSSVASSVASSAPAPLVWVSDTAQSRVNFITISDVNTVARHQFTEVLGGIEAGRANIQINLDSLQSDSELRDARVRIHLFETAQHAAADVSIDFDEPTFAAIAVGESRALSVDATVNLHGLSQVVSADVTVSRLSQTRVSVQSRKPVLLSAADFGLLDGINTLTSLAELTSISQAVPVDFALIFDAQ